MAIRSFFSDHQYQCVGTDFGSSLLVKRTEAILDELAVQPDLTVFLRQEFAERFRIFCVEQFHAVRRYARLIEFALGRNVAVTIKRCFLNALVAALVPIQAMLRQVILKVLNSLTLLVQRQRAFFPPEVYTTRRR